MGTMKRLMGSLFLLTTALTVSGCQSPTPVPGIRGTVLEMRPAGTAGGSRPVASAALTLVRQQSPYTQYHGQSGAAGEYSVSVPDDHYTILVSHPDYEDFLSQKNIYNLVQSLRQDFYLRRMTGEPAPDSTWKVAWRGGAAVTSGETTTLGNYRGKVVMLYLSSLYPGICTCTYEEAGMLSDSWEEHYGDPGTVAFLYIALNPNHDFTTLQSFIRDDLGYSLNGEQRNLADLSYPILFRENNFENDIEYTYDREPRDDWSKYVGKYNYSTVGSQRGFHRDGMGIAIIDQTGGIYALYAYPDEGVDLGPGPSEEVRTWTTKKIDELLNSHATLLSLWPAGPERSGLESVFDQFNDQYARPLLDVEYIPEDAYHDKLITMMAAGVMPAIYQVPIGSNQYASFTEALDEVYRRNDLADALPQGLLDILFWSGHPLSVPANVHRAGQLWYNKSLMSAMGINPRNIATYDQWMNVSDEIRGKGKIPLAIQRSDLPSLFEVILIDALGKENYRTFLAGNPDWNIPEVQQAVQRLQAMAPYITFTDDPVELVIQGKAAMTLGTDRLNAVFAERNFFDYQWMSPPGNDDVFIMFADSFGQWNASAPNPTAANFLNFLTSKEGQELFNRTSGTICARTDCEDMNYSPYQQAEAADWKTLTILPSLFLSGVVIQPRLDSIMQEINTIFP
jgi:ABC-type glycerol-3-phosphate transport system substrate-binding protein